MPWFRISSIVFAGWAVLFAGFPRFTDGLAALRYAPSKHADDWTQIVGVLCLGFAVLLDQAHRSGNEVARGVVARGVIAFAVPCALLMTYWQLIPERRWTRFDIGNIALLVIISCILYSAGKLNAQGPKGAA